MILKIFRFFLGFLLVPFPIGYAVSFYEQLLGVQQIRAPELFFLFGITAYLAFHALVAVPSRAYVLGHEMMHASAAWVSGGQVKGFKAGAKSGSVTTNQVTAFTALAPYLVPVYAVVWALLFGAAGLFFDIKPYIRWFFFGLGATLAFHLVFTVTALKEKQSDLDVWGPMASLVVIMLGNITVVAGVMSVMVPEVQFWPYLTDGFGYTREIYQAAFRQLFSI